MINNNPNSIIIVGRKDDAPEPINDATLQRWAKESKPETSGTKRTLALLLLFLASAGFGGILWLISFLAQL